MSKYAVFKSPANAKWYFHLRSRNGQNTGLQGYKRPESAVKAIKRFQASAGVPIVILRPKKKARKK